MSLLSVEPKDHRINLRVTAFAEVTLREATNATNNFSDGNTKVLIQPNII